MPNQPLKQHKSIEEQIKLLKSRGLNISDESKAAKILENINYYRLSGYLHHFKIIGQDQYEADLTFQKLIRIYSFDNKFTRILMYALENIEETYKTRFAYTISAKYPNNSEIYLDNSIYRSVNEFNKFKKLFEDEKRANHGLPFIKHHNQNYNGQLPIWVAVEIMTMGNLQSLYKNLKPIFQKAIAKTYNTGPKQMSSWLENITFTRNHLAHFMRIFRYNFGRTPISCSNHGTFTGNGKIFDQLLLIHYMYSDSEEWNNYIISELTRLINEYNDVVALTDIGFPADWEKKLS